MDSTGRVSYQIKDKNYQNRYIKAVARSGIGESEFNRLAVRQMITSMEVNGHLPPVKIEE